MREKILPALLLLSVAAAGQRTGVFAITDTRPGGAAWLNIREVSASGTDNRLILENNLFDGNRIDLGTQQRKAVSATANRDVQDLPLNGGVAALAYDAAHNRLYFSTMFQGDIRYVSLHKGEAAYYQVGQVYEAIPLPNNVPVGPQNQGPVITRMTAGADNYIYGLSNNGDAFFRLSTTSKKPEVESLGKLHDNPANTVSVHTSCSSWGGDMVAAADGSLYLFSMYQHVFRIDPATKQATHLGKIEGLPAEFSVNGAAVTDDGEVLLSSASLPGKIALIKDPEQITIAQVKENAGWYNTSDLASGNLLFAKKGQLVFGEFNRSFGKSGVGVFPNPVSNGQLIVHFKEGMTGRHTLDLLDVAGGSKMQSNVNLNGQAQRVTLQTANLAQGIYLLRVTNDGKKEIETIKVLIR